MASLNVIALISGGKDSLFAAIHCAANSHRVIALANLYPSKPAKEGEELDSYMYQTVGHSVIPHYAEALELPLYRRHITGSAVDTAQTYLNRAAVEDETEALLPLLQEIVRAHPHANAVCTGAILSTYQRSRVEAVAIRLGLTPLSYLWQYPYLPPANHTSLLHDMAAVGVDARIIKVASGGLDESHLGLNVASPATVTKLVRAMTLFGHIDIGSAIGEGGEFETLSIDGPAPLWKKRLEIQHSVRHGEAGTSHLMCTLKRLIPKPSGITASARRPELWDADTVKLRAALEKPLLQSRGSRHPRQAMKRLHTSVKLGRSLVAVANQYAGSNSLTGAGLGVEQAVRSLDSSIRQAGLSPDDIDLVTILLRHMSDFASLNNAYGRLFTRPLPPARVTIACGEELPDGIDLAVSCIARIHSGGQRQGLHVQSLSYWAPANIGPYSQSITAPIEPGEYNSATSVVYIAGQIPLLPASMNLLDDSFEGQAMLAFQHMTRIGRAQKVHVWTGAVACIVAEGAQQASVRAATALAIWQAAHKDRIEDNEADSDDSTFDVGDNNLHKPWNGPRIAARTDQSRIDLARLPDMDCITHETDQIPYCFVVQVAELPRAAPVEWIALGLSFATRSSGAQEQCLLQTSPLGATVSTTSISKHSFGMLAVDHHGDVAKSFYHADLTANLEQMEAWTTSDIGAESLKWLEDHGAQIIPCKSVWTDQGQVAAGIRWRECSSYNSPYAS